MLYLLYMPTEGAVFDVPVNADTSIKKKGFDDSSTVPFSGLNNPEGKDKLITKSRGDTELRKEWVSRFTTPLERVTTSTNPTETLQNYGLDAKDLYKTWGRNTQRKNRENNIRVNIQTIVNLEKMRPGCSRTLFEEFGIENFARYPEEVLIRQYDNRNNKELSYGVMIMNKSDHNGAFNYDTETIRDMDYQLGNLDYGIRIIECNSKIELISSLGNLDNRYGDRKKIDFAVVGAHGSRTGMTIGRPESGFANFFNNIAQTFFIPTKYSLQNTDMNNPLFQKIKDYFIVEPTWLLWSCSTGKNFNGFGKKLSKGLEAQVIAPDKVSSGFSVSISKNQEGKLQFHQSYDKYSLPRKMFSYIRPLSFRKLRSRIFNKGNEMR